MKRICILHKDLDDDDEENKKKLHIKRKHCVARIYSQNNLICS